MILWLNDRVNDSKRDCGAYPCESDVRVWTKDGVQYTCEEETASAAFFALTDKPRETFKGGNGVGICRRGLSGDLRAGH